MKPMFYSPAFTFSSVYSLGFGFLAGLRLLVLRQFKSFWPLALVQQAPPAIIFQAVRRLRGALLFRGLRPSSIWGFPFWLLALTFRSSRPAFGGRLTSPVSHHEQIVTLRINRLVMPTTRWVLRNVSPHQVSKHYSLARRKTTRCRTATHTREYCKIIRLAAKPPLGLAPRNRHLRASNLTDAYAF